MGVERRGRCIIINSTYHVTQEVWEGNRRRASSEEQCVSAIDIFEFHDEKDP